MEKAILYGHIIAGGLGLLSGTVVMLMRKGDAAHRLLGLVFSVSMLLSALAGMLLSYFISNLFLFVVGVFTLYLVGTGHRYNYLRKLNEGQRPALIDWLLLGGMALSGLVFVVFGAWLVARGQSFAAVLLVFGVVGLLSVWEDWRIFGGLIKEKNYWQIMHLQRMVGGYIAAVTAFLVVNARHFPEAIPLFVYWLLPTVIFVPLMSAWSKPLRNRPTQK